MMEFVLDLLVAFLVVWTVVSVVPGILLMVNLCSDHDSAWWAWALGLPVFVLLCLVSVLILLPFFAFLGWLERATRRS
jgi:hypothetical protein